MSPSTTPAARERKKKTPPQPARRRSRSRSSSRPPPTLLVERPADDGTGSSSIAGGGGGRAAAWREGPNGALVPAREHADRRGTTTPSSSPSWWRWWQGGGGGSGGTISARRLAAAYFLPEGYPASVSPDYAGWVAWQALQALSSYVRGVLSSHAVFRGVGVGSQAATALGAVFQFFVRDILGMVGGIVFAAASGGSFDANAKQWRLYADVMNDVAMALDLASPLIPGAWFMLCASLGSVARAMVGMAAGATHAALTTHFAAAGGNAADVSAKAESRERLMSIVGSLLGMALTSRLADRPAAAWAVFAALTLLHVWANVRALRCLVLSSLNEPRLRLLLGAYERGGGRRGGGLLAPRDATAAESLLAPPLVALSEWLCWWRWWRRGGRGRPARLVFGARLSSAMQQAAAGAAASSGGAAGVLAAALDAQPAAAARRYVLLVAPATWRRRAAVHVVLHASAGAPERLRAYVHALHLAGALDGDHGGGGGDALVIAASAAWAEQELPAFLGALPRAGWQPERLYLPRPAWTAEW